MRFPHALMGPAALLALGACARLGEADTTAVLEGSTSDGRAITGTDSIIVVPAS